MERLVLYCPKPEELNYREKWLSDPDTMSCNHACGGTIAFPPERWADWYARWVEDGTGERFYRYLRHEPGGKFVGEVAYHYDGGFGAYVCDVLVSARHRGRGFGRQGLALLCEAARGDGVKRLMDNIAIDNPSVEMFLRCGFRERMRDGQCIYVEKEL